MATALAETKGNNIIQAMRVLEQRLGSERMTAVLENVPEDLRQRLKFNGISRGGWYPVSWYAVLLDATCSVFPDIASLMRDTGFTLVERDLQGIYRILVRMITPQMLISWGPRTFAQYYRGGKLTVITSRAGFADAHYAEWYGFNAAIWRTVVGGVEAAIVACGATQARVQIIKGGSSDDARLLIHWNT